MSVIGHLLLRSQKGARYEANNWTHELKLLEKICSLKYKYSLDTPANPPAPNAKSPTSKTSAPAPNSASTPAPEPEFVFTFPPKSAPKSSKPMPKS